MTDKNDEPTKLCLCTWKAYVHCLDKAKTLTEDKINSEITQIYICHYSISVITELENSVR